MTAEATLPTPGAAAILPRRSLGALVAISIFWFALNFHWAALQSLVKMPNQGHSRSDLTSRPLRFWLIYSYLIAYAPDEDPLLVIAVLHGRRNPRVMAAILRNRE